MQADKQKEITKTIVTSGGAKQRSIPCPFRALERFILPPPGSGRYAHRRERILDTKHKILIGINDSIYIPNGFQLKSMILFVF
ncbi:MAG: hypothetical protein LBP98_02445 [Tannerella sp.]|nr:hypothetical protein [Tannerella sp.]